MSFPIVTVTIQLDGVGSDHPLWLAAEDELVSDLSDADGLELGAPKTAVEGTKGVLSEVLLSVTTPSAIVGAVAIFRTWIQRDARNRSLHIKRTEDGELRINGQNISNEAILEALQRILEVPPATGEGLSGGRRAA